LILGFHYLLEGGEGVLGHGGQGAAGVAQAGDEAGAAQAGGAGRLAHRAPLALRRLLGRQLVDGRVPHVAAGAPFLAHGPADLVGDLIGHAARTRAHQPALEISDRVGRPTGLAVRPGLPAG
jgi:hypothetical protein